MGKSSGETSLGSSFGGDGSRRGSDTFLGERAPNLMGIIASYEKVGEVNE